MGNILVINLKRHGDIFSSAQVISSLKEKYPHSYISLLVYDEFHKSAKILSNTNEVFTINRKEIEVIKKSSIFSSAFGIEALYQELKPVANKNWDLVINYSNDRLGALITSYLNPTSYQGIKLSEHNTIECSGRWASYLNEVVSSYKSSLFNLNEIFFNMIDLNLIEEGLKVRTQPQHNENAHKHLSDLRKSVGFNNPNLKLVGIQLLSSDPQKDIPQKAILDLIGLIMDDSDYYPILLIAPDEKERKYSNEINQMFENSLLTVESDFTALPSVLMNLDLIISPDTSVKHLADLVDLPVLEVSIGTSPLFRQSTMMAGNLILRKNSELNEEKIGNLSLNLYRSLRYLTNSTVPNISGDYTLYRVDVIQNRVYYIPVVGTIDWKAEITRIVGSEYSRSLLIKGNQIQDIQGLSSIPRDIALEWVKQEKQCVTNTSKLLLNSIREIKQARTSLKSLPNFINALEELLDCENRNELSAIPVLLFKSSLEQIHGGDLVKNLTSLETMLFSLKSDLQQLNSLLMTVDTLVREGDLNQANEGIIQLG